jgi:hypothetical protein
MMVMKNKHTLATIGILVISMGVLLAPGCRSYYFRNQYRSTGELANGIRDVQPQPYLKAHMKNGNLFVVKDAWLVDTVGNTVSASGIQYDYNRNKIREGEFVISIDSVAIFETNKKLVKPEEGRIAALSVLASVDIILGIICLTVPKACFGSCPTFYLHPDDNIHFADAEGFTNAIAPSMEYADIDALNNGKVSGREFTITMKNEALETHCVNGVKLMAYPRKESERVYQSPANVFYLCENQYPLSAASAREGDIGPLIRSADGNLRFSGADSHDLNSREEIFVDFNRNGASGTPGLILTFRQSLMTTYLFYSAMGYMGDEAGEIFAMMETDATKRKNFDATSRLLGGIEVYAWNDETRAWEYQDQVTETGPIALNHQILPLKCNPADSTVRLKLILNRGLWQIDCLSLTDIKEKVEPVVLEPTRVHNKGADDPDALASILAPDRHLISMPGSEYQFDFRLPDENQDYELFLYSKGYYLEWMRNHWLKDKNRLRLNQMVQSPERYLRSEARDYKRYESMMDEIFWNSKINPKTFSYHEN